MRFSEIIGHRHLLELLARASARDTLPPSLCFAGPAGVGKFTTAAALGAVLNCERPVEGPADSAGLDRAGVAEGREPLLEIDSCGACRSCIRLARAVERVGGGDAALDCLRMVKPDEKGSIKVGVVREVIGASAFRPFDGRRRVIVVDEADALEVSAQNALLKVLEEPPAGTVFVLVTARPDALLPTVRSRCPRLRFGPLRPSDLEHFLRKRGLAAKESHAIAGLADGSPGRALQLASGEALEARDVAAQVLDRVASAGSSVPARLGAAQVLLGKSGRAGSRKSTAATRTQVAGRLEAMAALLRDVEVVWTHGDDRWLAHTDLTSDLVRLARGFDGRRTSRAFEAVDRALVALERNVSHKAVADWLAFEL